MTISRAGASDFAAELRRDLLQRPKRIPSKYFYDALGSHLFEAICHLPWYRITRAERLLIERHAAELPPPLASPASIVELGSGSGEKLALLLAHLPAGRAAVPLHLVDVSGEALELAERTLVRHGHAGVVRHRATYEAGLDAAVAHRPARGAVLALFFGSNIGNFDPAAAGALLDAIRGSLRPGDGLLLGADLVKAERALLLAYDDPIGVTAAFNKNLLARLNREMEADFDLTAFTHRAVWDAAASRIEMHLVSTRAQTVHLRGAELTLRLEEGEPIWTESSYKHTPRGIVALAGEHRFDCAEQWVDPDALFALNLLVAR